MSKSGHSRSFRAMTLALAVLFGGALALTGCAGTNSPASTAVSPNARRFLAPGAPPGSASGGAASSPAPSAEKAVTAGTTDKLVVVTKTMRLQVDDVNGTLTKIRAMTAAAGGDITALQVSTNSDQPVYSEASGVSGTSSGSSAPLQAYVTVRVPAKGYAAFIDRAAKLGRVIFQSETSEDVTQQHVDMKARLRNLQAEEVRFRQFLRQARNVSDALKVERELERVRGEIESLQAQIVYLERQAAMATVTLELAEPQPIVRPAGVDWGFGNAITTGVQGMVGVLQVVIVAGIATSPLWIGGALIAWLVVWLVRRRRARRASVVAEAPEAAAQGSGPDSPANER